MAEHPAALAAAGDTLSRFRLPVDAAKAREIALALGADGWADVDPKGAWWACTSPGSSAPSASPRCGSGSGIGCGRRVAQLSCTSSDPGVHHLEARADDGRLIVTGTADERS